jgi:hypothetical protein
MTFRPIALLGTLATLATTTTTARADVSPYNAGAGVSAPTVTEKRAVRDEATGTIKYEERQVRPAPDKWGNAQGNQHDLAVDGAFTGQTVTVLQLYVDGSFDFSLPKAALAEKGFSTYRWIRNAPPADELAKALAKSSQLWLISDSNNQLTPAHVAVIKKFFDEGHGVYIWGDNEPYYADANVVAQALFGTGMHGDLRGDNTVGMLSTDTRIGGIKPNHLLSTGLEHIYEGITIATLDANYAAGGLEPLIYGSAGNLVAAYYDKDGKRAILDGGFTRLYMKWDTAGTARYVKNAAAWLVNAERFGALNPALATKWPSEKTPMVAVDRVPTMTTTVGKPAPDMKCPTAYTPSRETSSFDAFMSNKTALILLGLLAGLGALLYLPRRFR